MRGAIASRRTCASGGAKVERRAHAEAPPLNPQLPFWSLSNRLPDGAIVTADPERQRYGVRVISSFVVE